LCTSPIFLGERTCLGRRTAAPNGWYRTNLLKNAIEQEKECDRYEARGPTIALLVQSARLAPGLSEKEARDIFWTLTARDISRMLAIERQWSSDRYEKWLGEAADRDECEVLIEEQMQYQRLRDYIRVTSLPRQISETGLRLGFKQIKGIDLLP
jgi:hypothetical protein